VSQSFFQGGAEGELPVPEVVGEEADLDKDEGEVIGVQELEPGIVEDEQQGKAHRQKADSEGQIVRRCDANPWTGEAPRSHPAIRLRIICLGA
jgi:hypothetical protein